MEVTKNRDSWENLQNNSPQYFTYTIQLSLKYMRDLCKRGVVLQSVLEQALEYVVQKCSSRKKTGRPLNVRKVSLSKPLITFNKEVQIDFIV